jgi:gamma-glutamyl-gamma-aminobutyrate hydrolase PuuD
MSRPAVGVVTRRAIRKNKVIDFVAELHLELLTRLRLFPVMIPVVPGTLANLPQYARGMRGLLLVEGEDIEPTRYPVEQANLQHLEETHPLKDEIEARLARHALRRRLPILGICRGSQLLNVVCGGSLHVDVQKEKDSPLKHIDYDHYDAYRHQVTILGATPLQRWYRQPTLAVNSYHHQGIRRLARRFRPMAHADDGLVEAYYDPALPFLVGLQFHPERMLDEHPGNLRVWKAFATAVRRQQRG